MFYKNFSTAILIRASILGAALGLSLLSNAATAQLSNLFSSSGVAQAQTAAPINPGIPTCPPLIAGQPESLAPNGQPWVPGVNCTLQPAPGQSYGAASGVQATGVPLNTVDSTLVSGSATPTGSGTYLGGSATSYGGGYATGVNQQFQQSLEQIQGRVGLSYISRPDYLGANVGSLRPSVLLDLTFGAGGSLNNADGLGWRIISLGTLEGKLSLNWHGSQTFAGETAGLNAKGNQMHLEADLTLSSDLGIGYELEFSRPLSGLDGWTLTAAIAADIPMETGTLKARVGTTHASIDWMEANYGISASEALASGLSEYSPNGGLRDFFAEVSVDVPFNQNMGMDLRAGVKRAIGPAANAPQVRDAGSPSDYTAGASFYYRF